MIEFSNLTSDSRITEAIASFRGPMSSFSLVKSIDRNKGTARRWIVFSTGKRSVLVRYLFGKWLWDELNSLELDVFWHLPEITSNVTIYNALRAFVDGTPKKILRKRLEKGQNLLNLLFISRQHYLTLKGRSNWIFIEETITLRQIPKFSGYTKHHKDKGSLGPERDNVSVFLDPVVDISENIIYHYLTVGEISILGDAVIRPDENLKSSKR